MIDATQQCRSLRARYDMHVGATELIYPQHKSHMAQLYVLTSNQQSVTIWNHVGFKHQR